MNILKVEHDNSESIEVIDPLTIDRQCTSSYRCLSEDRKKQILIIEDNRSLAEVVSMIFQDVGNVEIAEIRCRLLPRLSNAQVVPKNANSRMSAVILPTAVGREKSIPDSSEAGWHMVMSSPGAGGFSAPG